MIDTPGLTSYAYHNNVTVDRIIKFLKNEKVEVALFLLMVENNPQKYLSSEVLTLLLSLQSVVGEKFFNHVVFAKRPNHYDDNYFSSNIRNELFKNKIEPRSIHTFLFNGIYRYRGVDFESQKLFADQAKALHTILSNTADYMNFNLDSDLRKLSAMARNYQMYRTNFICIICSGIAVIVCVNLIWYLCKVKKQSKRYSRTANDEAQEHIALS
jgi:hypothetical protein